MLKCGVFVAVVDLMRIVRKPVFGVSDQVTHKPGRTAIRVARGLKFRRDCSSCRAKTKALISCAVDLRLCFCIWTTTRENVPSDKKFDIRETSLI